MASELFTLAEAKSHLRVDHSREDADIESKVLAATEWVAQQVEFNIFDVSVVYDYYDRLPVSPNYIDLPDRVSAAPIDITGEYWTPNSDISEDPDGEVVIQRVLLTRDGRIRIYGDWDSVEKYDTLPLKFTYTVGIAADQIPTAWKEAGKLVLSSLYDGRTDTDSGPHFRAATSLLEPWKKYI